MMLRLILIRHASTAWAQPGKRDMDRRLNEDGISELANIRRSVVKHKLIPGAIYCSPAMRTRQTFDGIADAVGQANVNFPEILYSGYVQEYLAILNGHEKAETLMIVGHNPSCGSIANLLVHKGDPAALDSVSYQFPPGSIAVIDFDIDNWKDLKAGTGKLVHFIIP
jgi:phosphohistidine phosphatase